MTAIKTLKLIEGTAELNKEFAAIAKAGAKLDERIQTAALSAIVHLDKHGNINIIEGLMSALSQGARKTAMVEWILAHAPVAQNIVDGKVVKEAAWKLDRSKGLKMDLAIANPWYKFKPEKLDEPSFDFAAMLASLVNKATKASAGGKEVKGADVLARIQLLMAEPVDALLGAPLATE